MKLDQFWNTVPHAVRTTAFALLSVVTLLGLTAGIAEGHHTGQPLLSLAGIGGGLVLGSLIALWTLCLGFVFADARQRAMPPVLWTLIAALVPNLLGFLFYFALRRPLLSFCAACGRPIQAEQRFCSWCGADKSSLPPVTAPSQPAHAGQDSSATV